MQYILYLLTDIIADQVCSQVCRRSQIPVSNVCKAGLKSLFCALTDSELQEIRFEFLFSLIGKLTMVFSTEQS